MHVWVVFTGGVLQGQFLDVAQVRKLKDMPTRKQLMTHLARLIKKVRASVHVHVCMCWGMLA